ncbi:hypothetical protein [Thermococcus sp. JCM 11816]|uniref:hypothetical protein n=1 Tax=Thermococcus sp. (strain JCM 11816 / KS-1) TaxID=1295125 RepID=UPI0006D111B3
MNWKKLSGLVVVALFLAALAGTASAADTHSPKIDLPKWVIVPEDSSFSDVTLFCGLDAYDASTNTTPCYYNGALTNATITSSTTGYPKLVSGKLLNAFEFTGGTYVAKSGGLSIGGGVIVYTAWARLVRDDATWEFPDIVLGWDSNKAGGVYWNWNIRLEFITGSSVGEDSSEGVAFRIRNDTTQVSVQVNDINIREWHFYQGKVDFNTKQICLRVDDWQWTCASFASLGGVDSLVLTNVRIGDYDYSGRHVWDVDEARIYDRELSDDELNLLYRAGRKKLSEPANFRQIFSPLIDLTRDRATFYAGLEVSTTDPNGYVPVPESAVNMSITSAEKLTSDYTNAPFYYQGHYWYRADKIQFNLPIQFETVRTKGGDFDNVIILDEEQKTYVYEREFKVTNPTGAKLNVVYSLDPTALGFSVLQFPDFELDGVRMVSWRPNDNSTELYLIRTDTLEPGEISTHWIRSIWTLSKEELNFPAKLEDFRNILDWQTAQKMAENAAKGKADTWSGSSRSQATLT